jgi:hypothetical protein
MAFHHWINTVVGGLGLAHQIFGDDEEKKVATVSADRPDWADPWAEYLAGTTLNRLSYEPPYREYPGITQDRIVGGKRAEVEKLLSTQIPRTPAKRSLIHWRTEPEDRSKPPDDILNRTWEELDALGQTQKTRPGEPWERRKEDDSGWESNPDYKGPVPLSSAAPRQSLGIGLGARDDWSIYPNLGFSGLPMFALPGLTPTPPGTIGDMPKGQPLREEEETRGERYATKYGIGESDWDEIYHADTNPYGYDDSPPGPENPTVFGASAADLVSMGANLAIGAVSPVASAVMAASRALGLLTGHDPVQEIKSGFFDAIWNVLGIGEEETDDQSKDLSVTLENRDSLYDPEYEDPMMNPREGGFYPSPSSFGPEEEEEKGEEEKGYGFTFDPEIEDLDLFGPETDGESETDGGTDGGTGDGTESGTDDDDDNDFGDDME